MYKQLWALYTFRRKKIPFISHTSIGINICHFGGFYFMGCPPKARDNMHPHLPKIYTLNPSVVRSLHSLINIYNNYLKLTDQSWLEIMGGQGFNKLSVNISNTLISSSRSMPVNYLLISSVVGLTTLLILL